MGWTAASSRIPSFCREAVCQEGTAAIALEQHRNYSAIRDWNSKEKWTGKTGGSFVPREMMGHGPNVAALKTKKLHRSHFNRSGVAQHDFSRRFFFQAVTSSSTLYHQVSFSFQNWQIPAAFRRSRIASAFEIQILSILSSQLWQESWVCLKTGYPKFSFYSSCSLAQYSQPSLARNIQEWCWGAVLLSLVTALPHLAVHQEKRHVWVAEDTIGAVYRGSINCCKNSYAPWLEARCGPRFYCFYHSEVGAKN